MVVEAGLRPRYGCAVADRSIWLPAGLESPGLEPDDRSSQRGKPAGGGKQSNPGPTAAGEQGPFDQERPESKRERSTDSGDAERAEQKKPAEPRKPSEPKQQPEPEARKPSAKPVAAKPDKPQANSNEQADRDEPRGRPQGPPPKEEKSGEDGDQRPAAQQDRSNVDAMGQDKHRTVIGQRYGASRSRQLAYYGVFLAIVVVAYIGLKAGANQLDKAPAQDRDQAPWSKPGAPQGPLGGFEPREPGQNGPARFQ